MGKTNCHGHDHDDGMTIAMSIGMAMIMTMAIFVIFDVIFKVWDREKTAMTMTLALASGMAKIMTMTMALVSWLGGWHIAWRSDGYWAVLVVGGQLQPARQQPDPGCCLLAFPGPACWMRPTPESFKPAS